MKNYRQNSSINGAASFVGQKTPMFSNHAALSSSIVAKYTGSTRFTTVNKPTQRSKSRSPSGIRSPKESRHIQLYKRAAKASISRTKTPTLSTNDTLDQRSSFTKQDRRSRIRKSRENLHSRGREFNTKPEIVKVSSPKVHKISPKHSFRSEKSPNKQKGQAVQSPYFHTKPESAKKEKVVIPQPHFGGDDEQDEEPRSLKIQQIYSKFLSKSLPNNLYF